MQLSRYQALGLWWLLFLGALSPFIYILLQAFQNNLGAEPAKAMVEFLGEAALVILLVTLLVSPLRKLKFLPSLLRYRRMIGLWAFVYALMHVLAYGLFLVDWQNFIEDLYKRLYITVGAIAFLILLALAVTSPKVMVKRMGRSWKKLHSWVYVAVIAAVVHVTWQTRSDYTEALLFGSAALLLCVFRVPTWKKRWLG